MGQRSAAETVAWILVAFIGQRTWRQADLAERVGVRVPSLRKRLYELQEAGMPLEREEERPQVSAQDFCLIIAPSAPGQGMAPKNASSD